MEQFSVFDFCREDIEVNKPIRLIELFAGYGSQAMALERIGADFEHYRVVEFDAPAIKSYNAVHGTNFPTMDIRDVHGEDLEIMDRDKFTYLLTYSFPCQDISVAGLGKSLEKGSGTRSGLLWEVERLLNECESDVRFKLPQVLLMENVKNLLSAKHKPHFDKWCEYLETKGYKNYYQVMNAKNYGIPQNRERVFMVSVLGNYKYTFPKPIELTTTMKDFIEDKVDDRYYITSDKAKALVDKLILGGKLPVPKVGGVVRA